jgi:lipid II:glycine glycyltransferase (peptidoglycan interpeptide bridge formation enzyme)
VKNSFLEKLEPGDLALCNDAASFLQSGFWGAFKASFGWKTCPFTAEWKSLAHPAEKKSLLVLWRPLAPGISLAYIPWGPELPDFFSDTERGEALGELAVRLKPFLPAGTCFARFDPPWFTEGNAAIPPWQDGFPMIQKSRRAAADIQPPDTVVIDLRFDAETILAQMKSKWRYNIRLAEKKVEVRQADEGGLETFYALFRETAARDGIALHGLEYYKKLFFTAREYADKNVPRLPRLHLYLAFYNGEAVAGIITLFFGKTGTYLYGASSNRHRNVMAPYALQWRAVRDAKISGCTEYDFFGIPPNDDSTHPMAGLYRFKTGFGGKIIHRPGSLDYPYNRAIYAAFRFAEKMRKFVRDLKKAPKGARHAG